MIWKRIVNSKGLRNKQKISISETSSKLEEAKDDLNIMKINYFYMQEGIEIE